MKHALVIHLLPPGGGFGDVLGEYRSAGELLTAHPEIADHEGAVETIVALKSGDAKSITPSFDVWCGDDVTPEEYTEQAMALGHRCHAALLTLATRIELATAAPVIDTPIRDGVSMGIFELRCLSGLGDALRGRIFEPSRGKPMAFDAWCRRTTNHAEIGAGPDVLRVAAEALARNMGLFPKDPS